MARLHSRSKWGNPSNLDSNETEEIVHISYIGVLGMQELFLRKELSERCPYFWGVLRERFLQKSQL